MTFTYSRTRSEKLKAVMARTQGSRESLQNYFLDKLWLSEGLDFSVNEIRDEIATGIWMRELADYMVGREYTSTDSMLQDMVRVEKIQSGRRQRIWEQRDRRGVQKDNGSSKAGSGASSAGVSLQSAGKAALLKIIT